MRSKTADIPLKFLKNKKITAEDIGGFLSEELIFALFQFVHKSVHFLF